MGDDPDPLDGEPAPGKPEAPPDAEPEADDHEHFLGDEYQDYEPIEDDDEPAPKGRESRRRRLERLVPDLIKRAIERGIEAGLGSLSAKPKEGSIPPPKDVSKEPPKDGERHRELTSVPKEIAGYVLSQIDDTKNVMVRVVAREVRDFLEAADLSKELHKALTSLSFEIRTEIRFIPNEAGGIKPEVKAAVAPKSARRDARDPGRRPTALAEEEDDV